MRNCHLASAAILLCGLLGWIPGCGSPTDAPTGDDLAAPDLPALGAPDLAVMDTPDLATLTTPDLATMIAPDLAVIDTPDLAQSPDLVTPGCADDTACGGQTPRCDPATRACVPCLPANDNCGPGTYCVQSNGAYSCRNGCANDRGCASPDGGVPDGGSVAQACCGNACIDVSSDLIHCGACGNRCPGGLNFGAPVCAGGKCGVVCDALHADCNGVLADGCEADVGFDPKSCGACGNVCQAGFEVTAVECLMGTCRIDTCAPGYLDCNYVFADGCEANVNIDRWNCGGCNVICPTWGNSIAGCMGGRCTSVCAAGFGDCDGMQVNGCEVDTTSDADNCGGCGSACPALANANPGCLNSACFPNCFPGFADCDKVVANGCEVDLTTSAGNCGACGNVCPTPLNAVPSCVGGRCGFACANTWADCDVNVANGCETLVSVDKNNCGSCRNVCPTPPNSVPLCAGGTCTFGCTAMWGNCDGNAANGCETFVSLDKNNCGSCGNVCPTPPNSVPLCVGGSCTFACSTMWGNCDGNAANGCETLVSSDKNNCGKCGNVCPVGGGKVGVCVGGNCL